MSGACAPHFVECGEELIHAESWPIALHVVLHSGRISGISEPALGSEARQGVLVSGEKTNMTTFLSVAVKHVCPTYIYMQADKTCWTLCLWCAKGSSVGGGVRQRAHVTPLHKTKRPRPQIDIDKGAPGQERRRSSAQGSDRWAPLWTRTAPHPATQAAPPAKGIAALRFLLTQPRRGERTDLRRRRDAEQGLLFLVQMWSSVGGDRAPGAGLTACAIGRRVRLAVSK
ncbi:hypothetical protein BCR34DRAFT_238274 [Clohesyomyces aquaticus]|uniref:Uncharacterized protein n=1 Tax=Clohesyomyces aquaticus TaxID=1231657 RepID=A0A1Y1ZVL2_9PLEO|nr:hypothetical protein BCR34DRAFT_238274 [Clohesyomyces aquaticus]